METIRVLLAGAACVCFRSEGAAPPSVCGLYGERHRETGRGRPRGSNNLGARNEGEALPVTK